LRVGAPAADLSPQRPIEAESWLAILTAAGFQATVRYGSQGRDYLLTGTTRP
jgi:hypothetical protein